MSLIWPRLLDQLSLTLANAFLFLFPVLLWNIAFTRALPPQISAGEAPGWLLGAETAMRIAVFIYPVFLAVNIHQPAFKAGLAMYGVGLLFYFGSWLLLMFASPELLEQWPLMLYGPAFTPIIWLAGIAMMAQSSPYFALSSVFIILHVGEFYFRFSSP